MRYKITFFYFVQYLSVGILGPYFAMYLYQKGFNGTQIGLFLGSMPIAVMLLQPLWSYFSDIFNTRRNLLVISCLGSSVSMIGLGVSSEFSAVLFWVLLYSGFRAPIQPISNAITLDYLELINRPQDFGLVRLWGSVAFVVSSILLGVFFLEKLLTIFSWILLGIYLLLTGISFSLPKRGKKYQYSLFDGLHFLPENPEFVLYLIGIAFIGATLSISISYQTLFLDMMGTPPWLLGLITSLPALFEIPLMLLISTLFKRVSWSIMIFIGACALPIRWFFYLLITDPVWVIPTQILHSIAVVSFMVVGVFFIDKSISEKWRATSQGLYSTAMGGLGSGVGLYLAGYVLDLYDVRMIWAFNLILGLLGVIFIKLALRKFEEVENSKKAKVDTCQIM